MESLPLPLTDVILLVILLWGAWGGFKKGFIISVASFIAIIAGGLGAYYFSDVLGEWMSDHLSWTASQISVGSFAIAFIAVVIAVHLLAKALEKVLSLVALGFVNKIAGSALGLLKNALILSFIIYGLRGFNNMLPQDLAKDCVIFPCVESIAPAVIPYWEDLQEKTTFEEIKEKVEDKVEEVKEKAKAKLGSEGGE
jgi:membrane protein required for colicin V production